MKDPETNTFNHNFYPSKNDQYLCGICLDKPQFHLNQQTNSNNNSPDHSAEVVDYANLNNSQRQMLNPNSIQIELVEENKGNSDQGQLRKLTTVKVQFSEKLIEDFEDPLICRICFDNKMDELKLNRSSCKHRFCNACITKHILTNIYRKNVNNENKLT